ncbi:MAG: hypothetical protein IPJ65_04075 [Archangiaceae bacterium]|nr:hypothetical protein [Archangiaceae bacterium]
MRTLLLTAVLAVLACGGNGTGGTGGGTSGGTSGGSTAGGTGGSSGGTGGSGGGGTGGSSGGTAGGGSANAHLSGLPDCGTPSDAGTIADIYAGVVTNYSCGVGGCHGAGPSPFQIYQFTDPASLRTAWVNADAFQAPMKRITPGNIDQSYVIYKVWGQHRDAGVAGTGDRMPQGGPYMRNDELCTLINWVQAGAP